jgi:hypothetical protein
MCMRIAMEATHRDRVMHGARDASQMHTMPRRIRRAVTC